MMQSMDAVLERVGAFFMGKSPIHEAARRLAMELDALGIPYVIAGALAATEDAKTRAAVAAVVKKGERA